MTFWNYQKPPSAPRGVQPSSAGRPAERGTRTVRGLGLAKVERHVEKPKRAGVLEGEIDRIPRGRLFKVTKGTWFDLDGYFVVQGPHRDLKVFRGAPRKVTNRLTPEERRILVNARQKAVKAGRR